MHSIKDLQLEIYKNFEHSGLVLEVIELVEKNKLLEARFLLASILETYRDLNPLEVMISSEDDVFRHNKHVETIKNMEDTYSKLMICLEEHELLRK